MLRGVLGAAMTPLRDEGAAPVLRLRVQGSEWLGSAGGRGRTAALGGLEPGRAEGLRQAARGGGAVRARGPGRVRRRGGAPARARRRGDRLGARLGLS